MNPKISKVNLIIIILKTLKKMIQILIKIQKIIILLLKFLMKTVYKIIKMIKTLNIRIITKNMIIYFNNKIIWII